MVTVDGRELLVDLIREVDGPRPSRFVHRERLDDLDPGRLRTVFGGEDERPYRQCPALATAAGSGPRRRVDGG